MKKKNKVTRKQNSCGVYFIQIKQLTKELADIGDRIVDSGVEITEDTLIQYDDLQDKLSLVSKTVNDINVAGCPNWMYQLMDQEICELSACIKMFAVNIRRK